MTFENTPVKTSRPALMQAPVKALDPDGKLVLLIGTGAFAAAAIVCGILYSTLAASGHLWRFWVALLGTGLGLLALLMLWIKTKSRSGTQANLPDSKTAPF